MKYSLDPHEILWNGSHPDNERNRADMDNSRTWNARELGAVFFVWSGVNTAQGHVHKRIFWSRGLMEYPGG